jgi:FkbM family methyltransferase
MHSHYDFSEGRYSTLKKYGLNPINILDIGASDGSWSKFIKTIFTDSNVLSIEGNPVLENLLKNNNSNYLIKLLGNKSGIQTFYRNKTYNTCHGCSIYKENTEYYNESEEINLPIFRLDDLNLQQKFDFIKIDVQGAEYDILQGGIKTVVDCKFLQLELNILEFNKSAPLASKVISFLDNLNFSILDILSHFYWNHRLNQADFLFINRRFLTNELIIDKSISN